MTINVLRHSKIVCVFFSFFHPYVYSENINVTFPEPKTKKGLDCKRIAKRMGKEQLKDFDDLSLDILLLSVCHPFSVRFLSVCDPWKKGFFFYVETFAANSDIVYDMVLQDIQELDNKTKKSLTSSTACQLIFAWSL